MGLTRANEIRKLFGRYYSIAFTNTQAAAFQACIWEIENVAPGNPLNVTTGNVIIGGGSPDVQAQADTWLSGLTGDTRWFNNNVVAIGNSSFQDYCFVTGTPFSPSIQPVPEPVTLGAVALALGGLGWYVRRRTSRAQELPPAHQ